MGFGDFVVSQLARTPSRVLDVGCGDGQVALALTASGHEVTAIDPVAPEGPIFERVTLEEFVPSRPFDVVITSRSLHHVPDLDLAMDKIAQLAQLLIVEEFAWDRLDERTAAWYLAQLDGPSRSIQQCLREWDAEHAGLHGYESLRTEFDRRFREGFFAWCPYLHRYPKVRADQEREQALIETGDINALGFRYVGIRSDHRLDEVEDLVREEPFEQLRVGEVGHVHMLRARAGGKALELRLEVAAQRLERSGREDLIAVDDVALAPE